MSPPVVEGPFEPTPDRRDAPVAGVLLAAGVSSRFGSENKLLAEIDGEAMVRRAAETLLASTVDGVTVVVGHEAERVREALAGLDVSFVDNPEYREGQATSVRAGVRAVRDTADAAVFALGDMPFVEVSSVDLLVSAYRAGVGDALAAAHEGQRGNPVLFDAGMFDQLEDVGGDTGGRDLLLGSDRAALVETGDPGVVRDVNTREELDRVE